MENEESIALLKEISRDLKKLVGLVEAGLPARADVPSTSINLSQVTLPEPPGEPLPPANDPELWQPAWKVRKLLGISRTTLYRHTKKKPLVHDKIGGQLFYLTTEIFKIKDHYLK